MKEFCKYLIDIGLFNTNTNLQLTFVVKADEIKMLLEDSTSKKRWTVVTRFSQRELLDNKKLLSLLERTFISHLHKLECTVEDDKFKFEPSEQHKE